METPNPSPVISKNSEVIDVCNPATGTVMGTIPLCDRADVDAAVERASASFKEWAARNPADRGKVLYYGAELIRRRQDELARILTTEQGKPLKESRNEIAGFCRVLEYYASICGGTRGDFGNSNLYGHAIVSRQPLGVCGAIIPWNMPALIMAWKVGPALASGNSLILKPASSAPFTCVGLTSCLVSAGVPESVLQVITGPGQVVGEALAAHPDIRAVSFTGGIDAGRRVASIAGPLFKRMTLELGGSDPMIVCSDANLAEAAKGAVSGRFFNCGQTCTAVKRLFVDQHIEKEFIKKVREIIRTLKIGDGLTPGIDMGPVHSPFHRERLVDQIERTIDLGLGKVCLGGTIPNGPDLSSGSFFEPTVLTDLSLEAPVLQEEVFGPVLPVMPFDSLDDAIAADYPGIMCP